MIIIAQHTCHDPANLYFRSEPMISAFRSVFPEPSTENSERVFSAARFLASDASSISRTITIKHI